jgi:hypothetical protein
MSNEKLVEIKPIDLAVVWGTAFGQIADLYKSGWTAMLEAGNAESSIFGDSSSTVVAHIVNGAAPALKAQSMKGESFGEKLNGNAVIFAPRKPENGEIVIDCKVNESLVQPPVTGDIYRGEVVDKEGRLVARIALDAGS